MAYQFYMTMKGTRQGTIKGTAPHGKSGGSTGGLEVHGFEFGVMAPRDAASGLPSGKRQHSPLFKITKETDSASPNLFQATVISESFNPIILGPLGRQGSGSKGGSGRGSSNGGVHPVTITKKVDSASPSLFQACMSSEVFSTVTISFSRTNSPQEAIWHTLTLTNAVISEIEHVSIPGSKDEGEKIHFTVEKVSSQIGP